MPRTCHGLSLPIGGFAAELRRGPSADIDQKLTLLRDIQIHAAQTSLAPTLTLIDIGVNACLGPAKTKCAILHEECRRGAHLPDIGREPVGG